MQHRQARQVQWWVSNGLGRHFLRRMYGPACGNLIAARYKDEMPRPTVWPYSGAVGLEFLLLHENAQPHVARVCQQILEDKDIDTIDWPACCSDLNPIEHLRNITDQHILWLPNPPRTVQELTNAPVRSGRMLILGQSEGL